MLNKNAKLWVKALRSGKFKQTKRALSKNGKYCCLGVACELAIQSGVKLSKDSDELKTSYDGETDYLPEVVQKWLGLTTSHGKMSTTGLSLADRNDDGARFKTIANIIESEPEGLFEVKRGKK